MIKPHYLFIILVKTEYYKTHITRKVQYLLDNNHLAADTTKPLVRSILLIEHLLCVCVSVSVCVCHDFTVILV